MGPCHGASVINIKGKQKTLGGWGPAAMCFHGPFKAILLLTLKLSPASGGRKCFYFFSFFFFFLLLIYYFPVIYYNVIPFYFCSYQYLNLVLHVGGSYEIIMFDLFYNIFIPILIFWLHY